MHYCQFSNCRSLANTRTDFGSFFSRIHTSWSAGWFYWLINSYSVFWNRFNEALTCRKCFACAIGSKRNEFAQIYFALRLASATCAFSRSIGPVHDYCQSNPWRTWNFLFRLSASRSYALGWRCCIITFVTYFVYNSWSLMELAKLHCKHSNWTTIPSFY